MKTSRPVENKTLAIALLQNHARNYNRHSDSQIADLRASLQQFGQVRSVVVQANGGKAYTILAGHGIIEAAKQEGYTELRADVVPASWAKTKALAYLAADNELARRGDPDQDQLAAIVQEVLDAEGEALARLAAGEQSALDALLVRANPNGEGSDAEPQTDRADALQKEWKTASGQLWQVGAHRLLIGDCTTSTRCWQAKKQNCYLLTRHMASTWSTRKNFAPPSAALRCRPLALSVPKVLTLSEG